MSDRTLAMERLYWKERCSALEHIVERKNPALAEWWHRQQKEILDDGRHAHPNQAELISLGAAMQQRVMRPPETFRRQRQRDRAQTIDPLVLFWLQTKLSDVLARAWLNRRRGFVLTTSHLQVLRQLLGLRKLSESVWLQWESHLQQEARRAKTAPTFAEHIILRWLRTFFQLKENNKGYYLRKVLSHQRSSMRSGMRSLSGQPEVEEFLARLPPEMLRLVKGKDARKSAPIARGQQAPAP